MNKKLEELCDQHNKTIATRLHTFFEEYKKFEDEVEQLEEEFERLEE